MAPKLKASRSFKLSSAQGSLLRQKPRSGAVILAGIVSPPEAEPEPAVAELEEERLGEKAIRARRVFVARTVGVQFVELLEAFGMRQSDAADRHAGEAELVTREGFDGPTDGLAAVAKTELGRNDEDIALLALRERFQHPLGPVGHADVLVGEFAVAVVVELPPFADEAEDLLHRLAVAFRDDLGPHDREPAFGSFGEFGQIVRVGIGLLGVEVERFREHLDLFADGLGPIAARVGVAGGCRLVSIAVGDRQLGDEPGDTRCQFVAASVDPLGGVLVEGLEVLLGRIAHHAGDLFDLAVRCESKRVHRVSSLSEPSDWRLYLVFEMSFLEAHYLQKAHLKE